MEFEFIDQDWQNIFKKLAFKYKKEFKFITPFVQLETIKKIHKNKKTKVRLITRSNLNDFYNGVSSIQALEYILRNNGKVKGIKGLHSKLYIFDSSEAILSSANLTQAALLKNHEFGMLTSNANAIRAIDKYFDDLWNNIPDTVKISDLKKWEEEIDATIKNGNVTYKSFKFKDYGYKLNQNKTKSIDKTLNEMATPKQFFVKFFGKGNIKDRVELHGLVWDEVKRAGCHWACSYPKNKKPRQVRDGDIMFLGRLTRQPNDIMIFGYAIASKYKEGRDDATPENIKLRNFMGKWSRFIRVHDAQLIDGEMLDGISLNTLMNKFDSSSFVSTAKHKIAGKGNSNPKTAYSQQAAVKLTKESATWLLDKVNDRLQKVGRISYQRLSNLG